MKDELDALHGKVFPMMDKYLAGDAPIGEVIDKLIDEFGQDPRLSKKLVESLTDIQRDQTHEVLAKSGDGLIRLLVASNAPEEVAFPIIRELGGVMHKICLALGMRRTDGEDNSDAVAEALITDYKEAKVELKSWLKEGNDELDRRQRETNDILDAGEIF